MNASLAVFAWRVQSDGLETQRYISHTRILQWQAVADGPAWECARIEGQFGTDAVGEAPDYEARVQGALSLLVELDQVWYPCDMPGENTHCVRSATGWDRFEYQQ